MNKMKKFADKYFLRANEILKAEGLNPWVNMQVFVRKGPGRIAGIDEAVDIIIQNSDIEKVRGRIYAKRENGLYAPKETVMNIIAPVQEIMELETVYVGVITSATTLENDKRDIDLDEIRRNVEQVVELAGERPVFYFGARHWHYNMDRVISKAAFAGGVRECSTDEGAEAAGKKGVGTIPHALENVYAYYYGKELAVALSTKAFDRYMDRGIPRVALVDYANREITDTVSTIGILKANRSYETSLDAVRVDTCGENIAEGGIAYDGRDYWTGTGVTVAAVAGLRKAIDRTGNNVGIMLSSGFSNPDKVKSFNEGENYFRTKLYDGIGAGFFDNARCGTADIIAVGESIQEVDFYADSGIPERNIVHKVGRPPQLSRSLDRIL